MVGTVFGNFFPTNFWLPRPIFSCHFAFNNPCGFLSQLELVVHRVIKAEGICGNQIVPLEFGSRDGIFSLLAGAKPISGSFLDERFCELFFSSPFLNHSNCLDIGFYKP
jgi:hypothetical protein